MTWRTDRRSPCRGFTLIEVLVVLVILGLMVGLVVARGPMRSASLDLRGAASDVAQALRGARARAIATDHDVAFRLNVATHRYAVDGVPPHALPPALALKLVTTADQADGIVFAPDGSSSGGQIDLALGQRVLQVDVNWLTGRVSVAEAAPPP